MKWFERLYLEAPYYVQKLILNLEAIRISKVRYNSLFKKILEDYLLRTFWDNKKIKEYQERKLEILLRNFNFRCWDEIPVINKEEIKSKMQYYIKRNKHRIYTYLHTSGTTGSGLVFPVNREFIFHQWAVWWRYRIWHEITMDTWCGYFGGRTIIHPSKKKPPFWHISYPTKQILFSQYHLSIHTVEYYLKVLIEKNIKWLHGYPSFLSLFEYLVLEKNLIKLARQLNVRWITTGAETLLEQQKNIIYTVFGVKPIEHYGLSEGVANISMCPNGKLHVDEDFCYIEFLPTEVKNEYKIIGTAFFNLVTSFIRYDTGDIAIINDNETCNCGRHGRIITKVQGREEDYLVLSNGVKVGRLDHIFKDLVNIKEAQIFQETPGEAIFFIVKSNNRFGDDEKKLRYEIESRIGSEFNYKIEYIDKIPRTKAGKIKFVISKINN